MKSIVTILLLFISSVSFADDIDFPKERTETVKELGNLKIHEIYDGTKEKWPYHFLIVKKNDEVILNLREAKYEKYFASKDNRYFVGLSNIGIPASAFIIFDSNGKILKQVAHDFSNLPYIAPSITIGRGWFDSTKPEVKFEFKNQRLISIKVKTLEGKMLEILARDTGL